MLGTSIRFPWRATVSAITSGQCPSECHPAVSASILSPRFSESRAAKRRTGERRAARRGLREEGRWEKGRQDGGQQEERPGAALPLYRIFPQVVGVILFKVSIEHFYSIPHAWLLPNVLGVKKSDVAY